MFTITQKIILKFFIYIGPDEISISYSGYEKKSIIFKDPCFQCIFNDFGFLVNIANNVGIVYPKEDTV